MKKTEITPHYLSFSKRLIIGFLMVVGMVAFINAQTTVTYAQRIANYYATSNNGGTVGDIGSYQVGMTARAASPKQVVCWRKFRTDASGTNTSDRSMKIGDQFIVTLSATKAYGMIGFSLLSSPSATSSFANRESNYAVSVYLPGPLYGSWGNWTVKSNGGTTATASFGGTQSSYKNFTFTLTLIATDRMNITITDGTNTSYFFDVQLAQSNPITDYSIYQEDDWDGGGNMGCYWGLGQSTNQHTLTDKGALSLGSSNSNFTVSGVLTNGFAGNSNTTAVNNSFTKVGTGNITLSAANTYSGTTQIDGGSLILGINNAIPSGASGVQSAVTFNGGILSTGATSAGFSCGTSTNPMGVLTLNATGGTISMAATSSGQNLYFANSSGATWGADTLVVNGWTGTVGGTGTNGHIYLGNSASGLTASQLSKIIFTGYSGHAMLLSTGELVPLISPMYFSSGNFVSPNSWSETSSTLMTSMAGKSPTNNTTYYLSTNSNNTGSDFFKFFSNISGSGAYYGPSANTSENLSTAFTMSTANRAGGFSYYIAGTSGVNYFIKTIGTTTTNASAVVFSLGAGGVVRTVSSVAQSPVSSSVYAGYSTTVTDTISGAFTGSQVSYLRYSTSSTFTTSTVVAMTGSGTTYTATIPAGTNVAGNPVYYYVFTSGSGGTNPAADGSDADLFAINYNDNAGSNYSYTPIAGNPSITFSVASPGSGSSGYVGNTVTITGTNLSGINSLKVGGASGTVVSSFTVVNSTTITFNAIEATGTLWLTDGTSIASSAATYTNLGYISTAATDWNTASTWLGGSVPTAGSAVTIANAVTLNAAATNNPVSVTINSGKSLTLGASGALTINAGGSLTNNGTASLGGAGTITFTGTATITGASIFNNLSLNGTTTLNNVPTVNGTLTMNSGTTLLTNSPVYGSAGILNYNLNNGFAAKYNTSLEWPATSGPSSVTLTTNSWIQLTGDRSLTGDLTLSGGALQATGALRTLTMNGTTQTISISGGAIYGTDNGLNNDLQLTIVNGSTTTLTGNATSSADDEKKFYNINVNSGGKLSLSRGILCKFGSFTVGGTLQINANGYVQSNNTSNGALATTNASANYSSGGVLIYNNGGSFNCSDKEWPTTNSPVNVTIQNAGTNVNLNNSKTISGTLTLTAGALTTGANSLTVNGPLYATSGLIDTGASGTLVFGGTSEQNLSASVLTSGIVNNLTINAGSKLTTSGTITATTINILSDGTNGTGTLKDGGVLTSTNSNVQQYLTTGRNWYISSPVSAATSAVFNAAAASNINKLYWYDETNGSSATLNWPQITTNSSSLSVSRGYVANVDATLLVATNGVTFSGGTLNTGNITTGSNGVPALTRTSGQIKEGFNLVGNPYPSYLDWVAVSGASTNIDPTMWYRTKNGAVYEFDTYNATSGVGTNNATVVTQNIPPMQAFWVRVTSGQTTGTLALTNAMRNHNDLSTNKFRSPAVLNSVQSVLRLQVSNGVNADEAIVLFNPNASNGLDAYDSPKMTNADTAIPEIYTTAGTEKVVINGLKTINPNQELQLGFVPGTTNSFFIKATEFSNYNTGTRIILKDYLINTENDLTDGTAYVFSSDAVSTENRFTIIFRTSSVTTDLKNSDFNKSIVAFKNGNNQIGVSIPADIVGKASVSVYNAVGQKLENKLLESTKCVFSNSYTSGVYLVNVITNGKSITRKVVIN